MNISHRRPGERRSAKQTSFIAIFIALAAAGLALALLGLPYVPETLIAIGVGGAVGTVLAGSRRQRP